MKQHNEPGSVTLLNQHHNLVLMTQIMYISVLMLCITVEVKEWACQLVKNLTQNACIKCLQIMLQLPQHRQAEAILAL
jgi:hypothetical protein